jgi:hypothetical protein
MNLDELKPAWRQFILFSSMRPIDQKEILSIIEQRDVQATRRLPGVIVNIMLFLLLTVSCQGG